MSSQQIFQEIGQIREACAALRRDVDALLVLAGRNAAPAAAAADEHRIAVLESRLDSLSRTVADDVLRRIDEVIGIEPAPLADTLPPASPELGRLG